jgi:hypothetical protein
MVKRFEIHRRRDRRRSQNVEVSGTHREAALIERALRLSIRDAISTFGCNSSALAQPA